MSSSADLSRGQGTVLLATNGTVTSLILPCRAMAGQETGSAGRRATSVPRAMVDEQLCPSPEGTPVLSLGPPGRAPSWVVSRLPRARSGPAPGDGQQGPRPMTAAANLCPPLIRRGGRGSHGTVA